MPQKDVQGDPRLSSPDEGQESVDPFAPEPPHDGPVTDDMVMLGSPQSPENGDSNDRDLNPEPQEEETPVDYGASQDEGGILAGGKRFRDVEELSTAYQELQSRMGRQGTEVGDLRNEVSNLTNAVEEAAMVGDEFEGTPEGPQLRDYAEIEEQSDDPNAGFHALAEDLQSINGDASGLTREDVAQVLHEEREIQGNRESEWNSFASEYPHLADKQKLVSYVASVDLSEGDVSGMTPQEVRAEVARFTETYLLGGQGSGNSKDPNRKPLSSNSARAEGGSTRKSRPTANSESQDDSISAQLGKRQSRMRSSGYVQTE